VEVEAACRRRAGCTDVGAMTAAALADGASCAELVGRADAAMYRAQQRDLRRHERSETEMRKFLCRLLGHDRMTTSARQRICLRCGQRERLCQYGSVLAWEEVASVAR